MSEQETTATDALATLGSIIGPDARRDAIHLAVVPVIAGDMLAPGERVVVNNEIGIVDPFLTGEVEPGERFWCVILPRTIRSLRHVWSHPAIPDEAPSGDGTGESVEVPPMIGALRKLQERERSERWLRKFCELSNCPEYEYVMSAIAEALNDDDLDTDRSLSLGRDASGEIPAEFWDHVEVVLGRKLPNRPTYFSCSC